MDREVSDADTIAALRAELATVLAAGARAESERDTERDRCLEIVRAIGSVSPPGARDSAKDRWWCAQVSDAVRMIETGDEMPCSAREAVRTAQRERDDVRRTLGELLARIHRDGGHRLVAVGWDAAAKEADVIVVGMLGTQAALREYAPRCFVCDGLATKRVRTSFTTADPACDAHVGKHTVECELAYADVLRACEAKS